MNRPDGAANPEPGASVDATAGPAEMAEVLTVARESGDGSLLMRTLVRAELFVPQPPELAAGPAAPEEPLPLPLIESEGATYVVAFSAHERMVQWLPAGDRPAWRQVPLPELLGGWPEAAGLALDASSAGGILLPPEVVERLKLLASGAPVEEAYDLGPATRFRAGTPVDAPEELLAALRRVAADHAEVAGVRLLLVEIDEPGGRTWPVVGVLLVEGADADPPLQAMVEAVEVVTEDHVSFTVLPTTGGSQFEQVLREEGLRVAGDNEQGQAAGAG